jgi:hypothetical protein
MCSLKYNIFLIFKLRYFSRSSFFFFFSFFFCDPYLVNVNYGKEGLIAVFEGLGQWPDKDSILTELLKWGLEILFFFFPFFFFFFFMLMKV